MPACARGVVPAGDRGDAGRGQLPGESVPGGRGHSAVHRSRVSGARLRTVEGDELIDFIASWGALILGHAHPEVVEAIRERRAGVLHSECPTVAEVELAELICALVPSVEVVRMVNSGTEATASALRLARAATGRSAVIKFEGCYHGHSRRLPRQGRIGSCHFRGALQPRRPGGHVLPTPGWPDTTISTRSPSSLADGRVAAVIVEPVAGNMGCVLPAPDFLPGLRRLCDTQWCAVDLR